MFEKIKSFFGIGGTKMRNNILMQNSVIKASANGNIEIMNFKIAQWLSMYLSSCDPYVKKSNGDEELKNTLVYYCNSYVADSQLYCVYGFYLLRYDFHNAITNPFIFSSQNLPLIVSSNGSTILQPFFISSIRPSSRAVECSVTMIFSTLAAISTEQKSLISSATFEPQGSSLTIILSVFISTDSSYAL